MIKIFIMLTAVFLTGCSMLMRPVSSITSDYRKDDLDPHAIESQSNQIILYKLESKYLTDYSVSLVRMNVFTSQATENLGEVLLSFGLMGKEEYFNCEIFYSKLDDKQKRIVDEKMRNHPFICKNPHYTENDVLKSFGPVLSESINEHNVADSHWAWFSGTGDKKVLKRFLNNFLYNPDACIDCIGWSYSSMAQQDPEVKDFLVEYMQSKTEDEKKKLNLLLPIEEKRTSD